MPSLVDSRLLNNLIKTEKDAAKSFRSWMVDSGAASAALNTWATADSGDTHDIRSASQRITQLLATCSDSQRTYLSALAAYRNSLKDVLEKESSLRTVVRDREILVGRLIKLGNKKPGDSAYDSHALKLDDAQQELTACEKFLQAEEAALSGVKRRIFRESLAMRMRSMGELGRVMEDSAREAIDLLTRLGGDEYDDTLYNTQDYGSAAGDSISLSRPRSHSSSMSSLVHERFTAAQLHYVPPSNRTVNGSGTPEQPSFSISPASPTAAATPSALPVIIAPPPTAPVLSPSTFTFDALGERRLAVINTPNATGSSEASPARSPSVPNSRLSLGAIPVAARGASSYPILEVPTAPRAVGSRRPDEDSSDEEDERVFIASTQDVRPKNHRSTMSQSSAQSNGSHTTGGRGLLRRKAQSEDGGASRGASDAGARERKTSSGFFGGIASLFRRKKRDSSPERVSTGSNQWETRIDRNVFTAQRSGAAASKSRRHSTIVEEDSSDDEGRARNLIRVVNDPKKRGGKALSDSGVVTYTGNAFQMTDVSGSVVGTSGGARVIQRRTSTQSLNNVPRGDINGRAYASSAYIPVSPSPSVGDVGADGLARKKTKKKRSESMTGVSTFAALQSPPHHLDFPTSRSSTMVHPQSNHMSRSNTIQSSMSMPTYAPDGTPKQRKKRAVSFVPPAPSPPLTVIDLAMSLPSAASSRSLAHARAEFNLSNTPATRLAASEYQQRVDAARHGTSNWIAKPGHASARPTSPAPSHQLRASSSSPQLSAQDQQHHQQLQLPETNVQSYPAQRLSSISPGRAIGKSNQESLMTIVTRNNERSNLPYGQETRAKSIETSRRYEPLSNITPSQIQSRPPPIDLYVPTAPPPLNSVSIISPLPSSSTIPLLALPTPIAGLNADSHLRPSSNDNTEIKLARRKSVRLADGATEMKPSPAPSIRRGGPTHGILLNYQSPPGSANGSDYHTPVPSEGHGQSDGVLVNKTRTEVVGERERLGWNVRNPQDDSSDEDEDYSIAKRAFAKNTRKLDGVASSSAKDKGKGREQPAVVI